MRASTIFVSAAALAVASAQGSSSPDAFPQTSFLTQTNSLGVVTGMPAVATSIPGQPGQPALMTSQPAVASIPAVGSGIVTLLMPGPSTNVNATQTIVVSANNSTTIILGQPQTAGASATGSNGSNGASGSNGAGASSTSSGKPKASNAAGANAVAGSFVGAAAFIAAFL